MYIKWTLLLSLSHLTACTSPNTIFSNHILFQSFDWTEKTLHQNGQNPRCYHRLAFSRSGFCGNDSIQTGLCQYWWQVQKPWQEISWKHWRSRHFDQELPKSSHYQGQLRSIDCREQHEMGRYRTYDTFNTYFVVTGADQMYSFTGWFLVQWCWLFGKTKTEFCIFALASILTNPRSTLPSPMESSFVVILLVCNRTTIPTNWRAWGQRKS